MLLACGTGVCVIVFHVKSTGGELVCVSKEI